MILSDERLAKYSRYVTFTNPSVQEQTVIDLYETCMFYKKEVVRLQAELKHTTGSTVENTNSNGE